MTTTHGFELVRETEIGELNTKARLYRHAKTGAELLSLETDDENKVFGINFRTPVADSTGVPHILEHSVLGGSKKYPVKEPFIELVKGSMKTFLNAFTYPDRTCYPVASTNLQDFYNLIDVYLDAVFHPLLTPEHLEQEGWHFELDSPEAPLTFKGIVFNEMKGAYASPDRAMHEKATQSLFPDNAYRFSSGGDPKDIPNLTYEHFKGFYQTYYHPSNALIFFYGDDDPAERLRRVDEYLSEHEPRQIDGMVALQPRFSAPRAVEDTYAAGAGTDLTRKGMATVNWLLDDTLDPENVLAYNILDHILLGNSAAPLRRALIDSGLGEDVIGGGLNDGGRQMTYSVGLKGIAPEDAPKVEALVMKTLGDLVQQGLESDVVAASLNTVEFYLRENNTGSFPRGLSLMLRTLPTWLYGGDPVGPLAFAEPLDALKARLANGEKVFESLIEKGLVENRHRSTVVLRPDPDQGARDEAAEKDRLAKARAAMSPDEVTAAVEATRHLKERQEAPDDPAALARIPRLTLADLDRQDRQIPSETVTLAETPVLYHDLSTNGIVYLDLGFDMRVVPPELLPYMPLFGRSLVGLGTDKEDYVKLTRRIGRETGGIGASTHLTAQMGNDRSIAWFFLRGKAVASQTDQLLAILKDVLLGARLDNRERFRQMVLETKARLEGAVASGGVGFVSARLRAHFHQSDWVSEQMGGISYLFFIRQLAKDVDENWAGVQAKLEQIRQLLLRRGGAVANVTLDATSWPDVAPRLGSFLADLPAGLSESTVWTRGTLPTNEGLIFPGSVNYVGKATDLYSLGLVPNGTAAVITRYLSRTWLWDRIRVHGGAYGGNASFDRRSGTFVYLSWRDPNLLQTLAAYDGAAKFLREVSLDEGELTKAIIGAISDRDSYLLPDAKGWVALDWHLAGENAEERQRRRDEILATTAADFRAFADYLDAVKDNGHVVVLGGTTAIDAANQEQGELLTVTKVL